VRRNEVLEGPQIERAKQWRNAHCNHVAMMIGDGDDNVFPPSGADRANPALWKPAHWRWFVAEGWFLGVE